MFNDGATVYECVCVCEHARAKGTGKKFFNFGGIFSLCICVNWSIRVFFCISFCFNDRLGSYARYDIWKLHIIYCISILRHTHLYSYWLRAWVQRKSEEVQRNPDELRESEEQLWGFSLSSLHSPASLRGSLCTSLVINLIIFCDIHIYRYFILFLILCIHI